MKSEKFFEYEEIPIGAIIPAGWLKDYLIAQKNGLTGYLNEIGYPFNKEYWSYESLIEGGLSEWWPYEQISYWIDGVVRCAHLLNDNELLEKVSNQIEKSLAISEKKNSIGPEGLEYQWPHAIYFRALLACYEKTRDTRIINAMVKHYLNNNFCFDNDRAVVNVESMLKLYEKTGEEKLKKLAIEVYEKYNYKSNDADTSVIKMLFDDKIATHGVSFNEIAKISAIVYKYTGNKDYLAAAVNAYKKVDRDQMLVSGVHSASEELKGNGESEVHETCDLADYTWSMGYLFMMTGDPSYADKIEKACFNAAQGAIGPNFKSIQYYSCPNQVIATNNSNHTGHFARTPRLAYQPHHFPECCVGNVNRIMPNYVARMWMYDQTGVITAVLYGPSVIKAEIGPENIPVEIHEDTSYPFSDTINFTIMCERKVDFTLKLRIPAWCNEAKVSINGVAENKNCTSGTFFDINRLFNPGDIITLQLPMSIKLLNLPGEHVAVERGPIVYSLKINEKWEEDTFEPRQTKDFPAWQVTPQSDWNYALAVTNENINEKSTVVNNEFDNVPWWFELAPINITLPAKKIKNWCTVKNIYEENNNELIAMKLMQKHGCTIVLDPLEFTPNIPSANYIKENLNEQLEMIQLVPYGCTHLRLTVFPVVFS